MSIWLDVQLNTLKKGEAPMESSFIKLNNNLTIHTRRAGNPSSPPLVLIHGWPSSGLLWRQMIPELSKKFHVLVPDLPGHGKSDKPENMDYDLDFLRGFILDFYDATDLKKASLIVHDLGGMAGLSFAVRHRERLEKFVVMNTSPYSDWHPLLSFTIALLKQPVLTPFFLNKTIFRQVLSNGFYNNSLISSDLLNLFLTPWTNSPQGRKAFSKTIAIPPVRMVESPHALRTIDTPTLILWGTKDRFFPFKYARRLHQDIQNSKLIAIEKAGHFLQEEQPDLINNALMEFL